MANTFTQIHIHTVFAVQNRMSLINKSWQERLYKYIIAIIQKHGHKVLSIGGMPDHVHILFGFRPTQALSNLIQEVKRDSSEWINQNRLKIKDAFRRNAAVTGKVAFLPSDASLQDAGLGEVNACFTERCNPNGLPDTELCAEITPHSIHITDFDYNLPPEKIAKFPLPQRDKSKLLIWKDGKISENTFRNIGEYIPEDALLVFNNTKVIQARMLFQKPSGAQIEIFCLEPEDPADYAQSFAQTHSCVWRCLIGNAKRWKEGILGREVQGTRYKVERLKSEGEVHLVRFEWDNPGLTFADVLEKCGELPIPPYLNRKTEESDKETYQTIYSKIKGSVAAPTAGLHFTEAVFQSLRDKNIDFEELTLHVGAGTFKPVKSETLAEHVMHTEAISVRKATIQKLVEKEGKIFAVGTTSVRTLESLYYIGLYLKSHPDVAPEELSVGQWTPYLRQKVEGERYKVKDMLGNILNYMERKGLETLVTHTQIMIVPGYRFKVVNAMITNFHQPKSTLLLLISAFVKGRWCEIYDYALSHDFRFLSYGDSSLLF
ncbi:hypothetical protein FACS189451_10230 [Bacteroidia bacterium]|nr:hypothetical protein FACS189451_10230 [Bacteroidia bacterium]